MGAITHRGNGGADRGARRPQAPGCGLAAEQRRHLLGDPRKAAILTAEFCREAPAIPRRSGMQALLNLQNLGGVLEWQAVKDDVRDAPAHAAPLAP